MNDIETILKCTLILMVSSLKVVGRNIPNLEMVNKILRSLPKNWEPKVTAILEAKDLTRLKLEQLTGRWSPMK